LKVKLLEHVNINTTNLELLEDWYTEVLSLKKGYRPPFGVPGAWMYAGDIPMIHLLEVEGALKAPSPSIEHFAMRATGLRTLLSRLEEKGIPFTPVRVPELRILQINISDPEGNHMHIDFPPEEADELGFE